MGKAKLKNIARKARHRRLRKKVFGTPERPRLCVFRSNKHIYAQLVDDSRGRVLAAASSLSEESGQKSEKGKIAQGALVGAALAKAALEKKLKKVVFDRGGYSYHGRVKALADGAREGGLEF